MRSFVSASMIAQRLCSPSRDGQELLPHLVEKLITASIPREAIREQRFPHGDQIYLHGADGILAVDDEVKHQYVPSGLSLWEMSTSMAPKPKADDDFAGAEEKLAKAFPNITPSVTPDKATFVFVTSNRWEAGDWIKEKRRTSNWKAIRVLDAVAFEKWLEQCTTVMLWFADVCGLPAEGLFDAEQYLKKVGVSFGAVLPPELAIAGREKELEKLRDSLLHGNEELHICGESVEEAAAFLGGCSLKEAEALSKRAPVVFVDSRADLNLLATFNTEITLAPVDSEALGKVKGITQPKWRLVIPEIADPSLSERSSNISLGRCKRSAVEQCLIEQIGLPKHRARQVARDCKGSLVALLWLTGSAPVGALRWARGKDATTHASLMLAESWIGGNASDQAIIERLSKKNYREIETLLHSALIPEGPWIHRGVEWLCASRPFVWAQLAATITETMLSDFRDVVREVVGEKDPSLDLAHSDRHMASILGKTRKHSGNLRKGLMDSVARLALVRSDGQGWADRIVRDLLDPEHPEAGSRWLSLVDVYSELGEAAPDVFLNCLEGILRLDSSGFFEDGEGADAFFGRTSAHVYLLWALERLAWQKEHLPRVLSILAKLAEADPEGTTSNRPRNSLVTILLPWSPQHAESMDKASEALDMLYRVSPEVAWDVGIGLLPTAWSTTMPTPTPEYRPHGGKRDITVKDYREFIRALVEKLTDWADCNPNRLACLVEAYPDVRRDWPEVGDLITNALGRTDVAKFADADRAILYEALRKLLAHHRAHEDAEWALPKPDLDVLCDLHQRFTPSDPVLEHQLLFSWDPKVLNAPMRAHEKGWDEWVNARRGEAVAAVHAQAGLAGILRLAEVVVLPESVGQATATLELSGDEVTALLQETLSSDPAQHANSQGIRLGRGYAWARYRQAGEDWLEKVLGELRIAWTPELRANLALTIPATPGLWKRLQAWGEETDRLYWQNVEIPHSCYEHWALILDKWKDVVRPWSSIEFISDLVHERHQGQAGEKPPCELVLEVLEQALQADETVEPNRAHGQMLSYYVEQVFLYLDSQNADPAQVARLEWGWLRLLEHTKRGARVLKQQVISSPELFVDLLKVLFRAEGEQHSKAPTADQRKMGEQAFHLLKGIHTIPGQRSTDAGAAMDAGVLRKWVLQARELAEEVSRLKVCDIQIGQILSYSPQSPDGTWPCREVRDLIEEVESSGIERGFCLGKYNQRGVICRGKGGKQEWDLAGKYRAFAEKVRVVWSRTAAILERLAKGYEEQARRWDEQAKWDEYE